MIEELLPAEVRSAETVGADPHAYLLAAEQDLVARAVPGRVREVTYARSCARRALAELGIAETPIGRGPRGEPRWPAGVVGSITHTKGYYAAAVAPASLVRSIGIDAEVHDRLPDGVLGHIAFDAELAWLDRLGTGPICWDRLLFSAKESVYKAWFPLTGRWLGFEDALLTVDPATRTFQAELLVDGSTASGPPLRTMSGRFLVKDGFVLTAVLVPPVG
jgi:4'-phosphopantetheinyl transferase EntD